MTTKESVGTSSSESTNRAPPPLKALDNMAIVHDLVEDVHGRRLSIQNAIERVDRAHHSGTEATGLSQQDGVRHCFLRPSLEFACGTSQRHHKALPPM